MRGLALALGIAAAVGGCGSGAGSSGALGAGPAPASIPTPFSGSSPFDGLVVAGYQGWFGCPGDFEANASWIHWFDGAAAVSKLTVDMLPDPAALPASALCDTGLPAEGGGTVKAFTSMDPALVDAHFRQMAEHGVGAVAAQRFVVELATSSAKSRRDRVLDNEMRAARARALPMFVAYDVSGADPSTAVSAIAADWAELNARYDLGADPGYMRAGGRPVVMVWGLGFADRPGSPAESLALVKALRAGAPGAPAAHVVGGAPTYFYDLSADAKPDPAWAAVYRAYDTLSPWTPGRYATPDEARAFVAGVEAQQRMALAPGQGFLPVAFPGFSWSNLMADRGQSYALGQIPRLCGGFLQAQLDARRARGERSLYVAMFDELDEGTAMMGALPGRLGAPVGASTLGVADGCPQAGSDFYLGMLERAAASVRP